VIPRESSARKRPAVSYKDTAEDEDDDEDNEDDEDEDDDEN
jgi:hypothetical protein